MDVMALAFQLAVGLAAGLVIGFVVGRAHAGARASQAEAKAALAEARAVAAEEKVAYVEEQMTQRFQTLSNRALDVNNLRFLELAESRLAASRADAAGDLEQRRQAVENLVTPLRETLAKVQEQLRESETGHRVARAELGKQMEFVRQSSEQLRTQTSALVRALRRPEARGRWGELQLRRVAEIAGMARFCDFDEQASATTADGVVRPDMVVRLAGGKNIIVDSKVSLAAYLEAAEAGESEMQDARLDAHARHLRDHVDRLASKAYWQAFSPAPEFVVLFIPGEAFLSPALERDPGLLEHAMARRVHIATPTTLITMLRTAQYAWQQQALSENARAVFDLGKELYERLGVLGRNVDAVGKALSRAVVAYNKSVGSLEGRVLVSARKLSDLGVVDGPLPAPELVEDMPRQPAMPELVGEDQEEVGQEGREEAAAADGEPVNPDHAEHTGYGRHADGAGRTAYVEDAREVRGEAESPPPAGEETARAYPGPRVNGKLARDSS
ncbi:DNA recombination protein RmuC [Sphaerisporangium album]|uniref:DNA recombination protein RmuC n=1 Tax=Sphaerisporangium album TaxID=509200 RepID=A0A367FNQ9_9ACTN|nr:DNA recombination protein RmuC [Sphaerisporangium album]RCG31357.1 DNA recombination protein RmuC [Sphaerisporangium album]